MFRDGWREQMSSRSYSPRAPAPRTPPPGTRARTAALVTSFIAAAGPTPRRRRGKTASSSNPGLAILKRVPWSTREPRQSWISPGSGKMARDSVAGVMKMRWTSQRLGSMAAMMDSAERREMSCRCASAASTQFQNPFPGAGGKNGSKQRGWLHPALVYFTISRFSRRYRTSSINRCFGK